MNEQKLKTFSADDKREREEMEAYANKMLNDGWKITHIAGAGGKQGTSLSYAIVFEKASQMPYIK